VYNLLCWPIRRTSAPGSGRHLESLLRKSTLAVRLTLHHPQLLIAHLLILVARWIPSRQGAIAGGRAKGQGLLAPRLDMISYAVLWTPLDTTFGLRRQGGAAVLLLNPICLGLSPTAGRRLRGHVEYVPSVPLLF